MAEAARIEQMQVPNGGIADFVMSDEDIEAVYGPDEDGAEEYGTEGLGQFTEVANQMAEKGRYGDDTVAHLESGELVIPKAFLDQDPEMAKTLFAYLESKGVEDPQRYVVGSDANSINPETGLPEFFFRSVVRAVTRPVTRAVKSVAKTVSKVAKPVIKIIQKAAPIVLPMVLAATPLGPVFGAALGGGIASLINGGSLKDAFKQALIGGALGAAGAGFKGMFTPGQTFMGGISNAVSDPIGRFGQTFAGAQNSLSALVGAAPTAGTGAERFFQGYMKPGELALKASGLEGTIDQATATGSVAEATSKAATVPSVDTFQEIATSTQPLDPNFASDFATTGAGAGQVGGGATQTTPSFLDTAKDYGQRAYDFVKGESSLTPAEASQISADKTASFIQDFNKANNTSFTFANAPSTLQNAALKAGEAAAVAAQPGFIDKYGPMALAGAGTLALSEATGLTNFTDQFFTPAPQEETGLVARDDQGNVVTGETIVRERPQDYLVSDLGQRVYNPATGQYELVQNLDPRSAAYTNYVSPTSFNYDIFSPKSTPGGPFERPVALVADGGPIFPRRNGGIMPNEGVPGKDSVRAMLMPGEFVMTTDAVRGAGGGSLNEGIKNMYSVMRNLESRGRRMA